jgi:hypothetical protein
MRVLTDGDSGFKIVILTPAPGCEDETKLRLAVVAGLQGCSVLSSS